MTAPGYSSARPTTPNRSDLVSRVSGFSLVEVMVALVVVSVGLIGMAALYGQGLSASQAAIYRSQAANLAADMADRIRVNRLGAAAYGGAAADNGCDPAGGGGIDCTPAEMAAHDLLVWDGLVRQALPDGAASVAVDAATLPPTYTIRVTWAEPGTGPAEYELEIQVPDI